MFQVLLISSLPYAALPAQEVVQKPSQSIQELLPHHLQPKEVNEYADPDLISQSDIELIDIAREKLKEILLPDRNFVVTAIRTKKGTTFTGINLKTTATRASVCAESNALAKAIESDNSDIETLVNLAYLPDNQGNQKLVICSPCGICRELLYDYAPDVRVIVFSQGSLKKVPISELLVHPYKR